MALYRYTAMSEQGNTVRGTLEADSTDAFYAKLKNEKLYCLKVREDTGVPLLLQMAGAGMLPARELAIFLRQMASMISAGITIDRAIDLIYGQCGEGRMKAALSKLYGEVRRGNQFSAAMGETGGAFGMLVRNMALAGENSGTLGKALDRLAGYYEKEIKLRNRALLAMLYPIVLTVVSLTVILILFVVVLPSFLTLFQSAESLPWYTRLLIAISDFTVKRWYVVATGFFLILMGFAALSRQEGILLKIDKSMLRAPIFGKLQTQLVTARFCRVFASLYMSGIHVLEALELSGGILGNRYFKLALDRAAVEIQGGVPLSQALKNQEVFPEMMISMLTVGEESGAVGEMLTKISDYYDEEADAAIQRLIGLLQPVIIVVLGGFIAFIMISVLKPIYNIYQNMQ